MAWFKRKNKTTEKPKAPKTEPKSVAEGFFSTHRQLDVPRLSEWINQNAFQKTAPTPVQIAGVAFDASGDGFSGIKNTFQLGQNGIIPETLFAWYVSQGFIGFQACAIIAQHWLVNKACSVAPQDAIRKGYEITVNDGSDVPLEALERLKIIDKEHSITKQLAEFAKFNRIFGIRIAVFHVESSDPFYYEKPFNIDGVTIGSYKGFSQVDPYWITPELDPDAAANTASRHFYEPTWWRINGKRYHRSHLIVIRLTDVADVLKPSYIFGGIPLTQQIFERVYAAERTANEAPLLALTKRSTVLKVDTEAALADQAAFEEKLAAWMVYRDNYGVKVCGLSEEMQQIDTALTDLDALIMTQYQIVAAIANTPATKLLGTQPKGFNSTGEYEEAVYHEYLESIQANEMQPLLQRHHELSIRSDAEIARIMAGKGLFSTDIQWKPLDSMTENEAADVQLKKAQTDQILQMSGAISGEDIRTRITADKFSGYNGLENIESDEPDLDDDYTDIASEEPTMLPSSVEASASAIALANKQHEALNGAQVASMVSIVQSVAAGALPRDSGVEMLVSAFTLPKERAEAIMGEAGKGFVMKGKPVSPDDVRSVGNE